MPVLMGLAILAGNGCTWFDTSPMSTNIRNFPTERGFVVGIIKSCIGLCGGFYSIVVFQGMFHGDAAAFLKFLSWGPSLVVACCVPCINYVPFVQESERWDHMNTRRFHIGISLVGVLTVYVLGVSLVGGLMEVTDHMQAVFAVGGVMLLLPLLGITYDSGGFFAQRMVHGLEGGGITLEEAFMESGGDNDDNDDNDDHVGGSGRGRGETETTTTDSDSDGGEDTQEQRRLHNVYPSYGLMDVLKGNVDFYLVALVCGVGIASGLTFLNNASQLVGALGGGDKEKTVVIALFSCSSCLGRLLYGAVSEHALHAWKVSRCWFLILAAAGATMVYITLAFESIASPLLLYPVSLASGFWFGGHWSLLPALASELFGLRSFAYVYFE